MAVCSVSQVVFFFFWFLVKTKIRLGSEVPSIPLGGGLLSPLASGKTVKHHTKQRRQEQSARKERKGNHQGERGQPEARTSTTTKGRNIKERKGKCSQNHTRGRATTTKKKDGQHHHSREDGLPHYAIIVINLWWLCHLIFQRMNSIGSNNPSPMLWVDHHASRHRVCVRSTARVFLHHPFCSLQLDWSWRLRPRTVSPRRV